MVLASPPDLPPWWSPSRFFTWAPGSHSLYPSFVWECVPGSGALLFPTTFSPCHGLSGASLSSWLTRMTFLTLWQVVICSFSIGCWLILMNLVSLLLGLEIFLSFLLALVISFSYVGFLSYPFRVLSVLRFVRILGFPPLLSLLVSPFSLSAGLLPWLFSFRCHLHPPLPPVIAGSRSLSLPSSLPLGVPASQYCPLLIFWGSFLLLYMASCSWASYSFFRLGSWGASLPVLPSVSLRFCVRPGVHVFLIPASTFLLDSPAVFVFRASGVLPCDFSSPVYFSFCFPSGRFGVCLP